MTLALLNRTVNRKEVLVLDLTESLMKAAVIAGPYESPGGNRYDPPMAKVEQVSIEDARKTLGQRYDKARDEDLHTALTKHGRPGAVLVPIDWYRRMRELDGDPTDL